MRTVQIIFIDEFELVETDETIIDAKMEKAITAIQDAVDGKVIIRLP